MGIAFNIFKQGRREYNACMQKIFFSVDGQKLYGTFFKPANLKAKNPAILFIHGWSSSEQPYLARVKALAKLGYVCLAFSMRGHGTSEGDIKKQTRQDFLTDAIAAYDFLVEQKDVDENSISIVGASFGAYLAALVSQERPVKNLTFRVPANYSDENFNDPQFHFSGDNSVTLLHPKFKKLQTEQTYALKALRNFSGNILIIESEKDELIPHQVVENYLNSVKNKNKLKHIVMKNVGHNLKDEKTQQEFIKILTDWFKDKV